jgi:hypothetical protein
MLVATLPVLLDVLFKYLIFRHLNRSSPALYFIMQWLNIIDHWNALLSVDFNISVITLIIFGLYLDYIWIIFGLYLDYIWIEFWTT